MSDLRTRSPHRRSYESGRLRKYLIVVDETPECSRALSYAARRAVRTGAALSLLAIVEPPTGQTWLSIEDVMRQDALEEAQARLAKAASLARAILRSEPEHHVRTGETATEILRFIEEDESIATLVLASSTGPDGPGPLVSMMANEGGRHFLIPVTIIPGCLSDADIDMLA